MSERGKQGRNRVRAVNTIDRLETEARRDGWCEAVTMMETAVLAGDDPIATLTHMVERRDRHSTEGAE